MIKDTDLLQQIERARDDDAPWEIQRLSAELAGRAQLQGPIAWQVHLATGCPFEQAVAATERAVHELGAEQATTLSYLRLVERACQIGRDLCGKGVDEYYPEG